MILKTFKKLFYFLGSIKLAVPSMLALMIIIASGTIIESRYNAEYARLLIYQSWWFNALLIVIWFNILFATLTRLPWKKHHIGFLITHLGLLMIFGGGFLTNVFGIDGSMRVPEGESSRHVVLPDLVLSVRSTQDSGGVDYPISRSTSKQKGFSFINEKLRGLVTVMEYEPFVAIKEILKINQNLIPDSTQKINPKEPFEILFRMKSSFFDVQQSLNSQGQNQLQMEPAHFRLIHDTDAHSKPLSNKSVSNKLLSKKSFKKSISKTKNLTLITKIGSKNQNVEFSDSDLKDKGVTIQFEHYEIRVKNIFYHATVAKNGLQENPDGPFNPALVIEIKKNGEIARDVLFAKYPDFSLRKGKFQELSLEFHSKLQVDAKLNSQVDEANGEPNFPQDALHSSMTSGAGGNQVIFFYSESHPEWIKVELQKAGKVVSTKNLKQGEIFQTPWMGMELTINQIAWNAEKELQVIPVSIEEKATQVPPSALKINRWEGAPAEETWVVEGDEKNINFDGKSYTLYYGRKIIELPIAITLKEFKKSDYPGTSMAKEYESHVQLSGEGVLNSLPIRISMNQPLHEHGYTFYQASYEEIGGGKFASIFSVNRDPGRWFKYMGGLILALGIIIYTLSKSRRFKGYFEGKKHE